MKQTSTFKVSLPLEIKELIFLNSLFPRRTNQASYRQLAHLYELHKQSYFSSYLSTKVAQRKDFFLSDFCYFLSTHTSSEKDTIFGFFFHATTVKYFTPTELNICYSSICTGAFTLFSTFVDVIVTKEKAETISWWFPLISSGNINGDNYLESRGIQMNLKDMLSAIIYDREEFVKMGVESGRFKDHIGEFITESTICKSVRVRSYLQSLVPVKTNG